MGVRESGPLIREVIAMTQVRALARTRKGAFVLTSDGKREKWSVSGPHFGGLEMYRMKGSPAEPNRLYASQDTGWFGQLVQRSDSGGASWQPVGNGFSNADDPGTHLWYDETPQPWEFKRIWHLEPSHTDPDTVYAGAKDAALFKSTDGGVTWNELTGLKVQSALEWGAGAGGLCDAHDHAAGVADVRGDLPGRDLPVRQRRRHVPDLLIWAFTSNQAERDVRPVKVQQRSSGGCWRDLQGLGDFAIVQSYLSGVAKWGIDALAALPATGPWLPAGIRLGWIATGLVSDLLWVWRVLMVVRWVRGCGSRARLLG
jgi:hypothetical protein